MQFEMWKQHLTAQMSRVFKLAGERLSHSETLRGGFLKSAWKC